MAHMCPYIKGVPLFEATDQRVCALWSTRLKARGRGSELARARQGNWSQPFDIHTPVAGKATRRGHLRHLDWVARLGTRALCRGRRSGDAVGGDGRSNRKLPTGRPVAQAEECPG